MAVSDDLARLSARARMAEERVASAQAEARERLEQDVEEARRRTQEAADRMRQQTERNTRSGRRLPAVVERSR